MDKENDIINYNEGKSDLVECGPSDCLDEKELFELGYRRMTSDEEKVYSGLLQPFLRDVVNHCNNKNISKQFKDAVANSYFLHIDKDLNVKVHLANSSSFPGAFKGLLKDNEANTIVAHADWIKNESELNISKMPNLVNGAMDILAKLTNQYFMSQINNKFAHIDEKLNRIENMLETDRESRIKNAHKQVKEIENYLETILKNESMRDHTISRLDGYIDIAGENMETCKKDIDSIRKSISEETKVKDLNEKFKSLFNALQIYNLCVDIVTEATYLKIILYKLNDIKYIEDIKNKLSNEIKMLDNNIDGFCEWMDEILKKNKEYNAILPKKKIATAIKLGISIKLDELIYGEDKRGPKTVEYLEKINEDKQMIMETRSSIFKEISSLKSSGTSYVGSIDSYLKSVENGTSFVVVGEKYYTNLPNYIVNKIADKGKQG